MTHPATDAILRSTGWRFRDETLLLTALTHSSYTFEQGGEHNERLEFLGDSVLSLCVTTLLMEKFPGATEGQLSRMRAELVRTESLGQVGERLGLDQLVRLGKGEEATGGRSKPSILENTAESLLGAIFVEGGLDACRVMVQAWFAERIDHLEPTAPEEEAWKDPRSRLQEHTQAALRITPHYTIDGREGPDHAPTFTATAWVGERAVGHGSGPRRKDAFRDAARDALDHLLAAPAEPAAADPDDPDALLVPEDRA